MKRSFIRWSILCVVVVGIFTACSNSGRMVLKVNPSHLPGSQFMPDEISRMLDDLGYERLPIKDPAIRRQVEISKQFGHYRMRFRSRERTDIRIDVQIGIMDGRSRLYFYTADSPDLDPTSEPYYRRLRERLMLEFGEDHVSGG